jgi:hypothetical protein
MHASTMYEIRVSRLGAVALLRPPTVGVERDNRVSRRHRILVPNTR